MYGTVQVPVEDKLTLNLKAAQSSFGNHALCTVTALYHM